jgi:MFS transporter, DHA2 family, multidrug resistance protein
VERSLPAATPPEAAVATRDTLGGAVEVAARQPGGVESQLLEVAREAFTQGLRLSAWIGAAAAVAMAIIAAGLLRDVTQSGP